MLAGRRGDEMNARQHNPNSTGCLDGCRLAAIGLGARGAQRPRPPTPEGVRMPWGVGSG